MRNTLTRTLALLFIPACSPPPPGDSMMPLAGAGMTAGGAAGGGVSSGEAGTAGTTESGGVAGTDTGAGGVAGAPTAGGADALGGASSAGSMGLGGSSGAAGSGYVPSEEVAMLLSETGLYSDVVGRTLAPGVEWFQPQFALWSDTAAKNRWLWLPPGTQIDTTDMDNWVFPVGTKIWKEFTRDDVLIETRLIERYGAGGRRWKMLAYIWNDEGTDAVASPMGLENAKGTDHDVPNEKACEDCHNNREDKPIGVSAVQLSHEREGLTMAKLIQGGRLTAPPTEALVVPGTEIDQAALGYLHANCGNCHRDASTANSRVDVRMWLEVSSLGAVETTDAYTQLVNQRTVAEDSDCLLNLRVFGGDPSKSEIIRRMSQAHRALKPMPPVGSELEDPEGIQLIGDWINSLPAPAGEALPDPCCANAAETCCVDNPASPSCP